MPQQPDQSGLVGVDRENCGAVKVFPKRTLPDHCHVKRAHCIQVIFVWYALITLRLEAANQPALFGVLDRIRDFNLTLISVNGVG